MVCVGVVCGGVQREGPASVAASAATAAACGCTSAVALVTPSPPSTAAHRMPDVRHTPSAFFAV